jgi:beta-N-acetylhexosaminidase
MESEGGAETAREQGLRTGRALRKLGIDVDLAPVLDLGEDGSFVAARTFSADPAVVGELGTEFAAGLAEGGVAATAKHFPGLGTASADTDAGESVVDAPRAELDRGLAPFEAAIAADVPLIMTANATYSTLDEESPATLSRAVTTRLLRDELGFDGTVITDDLGAGAIVSAGLDEREAALAAAGAGADLLLFALSDGSDAAKALERALRRGELERGSFVASCERLTALRERLAGFERAQRLSDAS